jgi:hypothetical protein
MEMRLQRLSDPEFPNSKVVSKRFGSRVDQINRLRSYVDADPALGDVAPLLGPPAESASHGALPGASPRAAVLGQVYLLKLGRHYKIGRSNAFGRRERELSIQMPERATTVHVIQTDDPVGIERYWHVRFMERRVRPDAEWFALTNEDVAAFKRRRFQ